MKEREWQAVYEEAFPKLYRALVAMGARPYEAEDALQDAFVRGLRADRELDNPEGWLFVVACRAWRRSRIRNAVLGPLSDHLGRSEAPSALMVDLLEELGRLTLRQRQIFVARYVLGYTQEETAHVLGIARGSVSATTAQVTALLRTRLESSDDR